MLVREKTGESFLAIQRKTFNEKIGDMCPSLLAEPDLMGKRNYLPGLLRKSLDFLHLK